MSKFIFFYGHKNNDYDYLSNFYITPFKDDNDILYCCVEQYFVKKKQLLFDHNNDLLGNKIMNSINPFEIKKYGREVNNFNNDIWEKIRYNVMLEGLKYKFKNNEELKKKLISTYPKFLVEASPYDKIWGIGLNKHIAEELTEKALNENLNYDYYWQGDNLLGKALMEIRHLLIKKIKEN